MNALRLSRNARLAIVCEHQGSGKKERGQEVQPAEEPGNRNAENEKARDQNSESC